MSARSLFLVTQFTQNNLLHNSTIAGLEDLVQAHNLAGIDTINFTLSVGHQKEQMIHRSVCQVKEHWPGQHGLPKARVNFTRVSQGGITCLILLHFV